MIYLDNSATTKPCKEAVAAMMNMLENEFGNPSSRYTLGLRAERALNEARESVASSIHAQAKQIIFTSGGTESDNLAILGGANIKVGNHAVTTMVEHPAVLNSFHALEKLGFNVTYVAPSSDGVCKKDDILNAITDKTSFVSIMHVNNETGAIMPITELSSAIKRKAPRAVFHVDAVQSYGKIDLFPSRWGIDLMSISSHKVHGPKGIGALYKGDKVNLKPTVFGGGQEGALRSGTENMPGIAGFGAAAALINPSEVYEKIAKLKANFAENLLKLDGVELNGGLDNSSPYILNVSFIGIRSEIMLNALSEDGIYVSAGSACARGSSKASSVLRSMGRPHSDNAIRFSFSKYTNEEEINAAYEAVVKKLEILK